MKFSRMTTYRGFALVIFKDRAGEECSLQKSSVAGEDCVWLGLEDAKPQVMASRAHLAGVTTSETTGWVEYPIPDGVHLSTRMHLSRDQVAALIPLLQAFVDTGEVSA